MQHIIVVVFQGSWPGQTSMIFKSYKPALKHSFTPNVSPQMFGASSVESEVQSVKVVVYQRCESCRLLCFILLKKRQTMGAVHIIDEFRMVLGGDSQHQFFFFTTEFVKSHLSPSGL